MSLDYYMKYLIENYWENATTIVSGLRYFINTLNLESTFIGISVKPLLAYLLTYQ